ncbi:hypothetical protein MLD52_21600, partial [Puniceicoccaceae bacterium K14]|nr:hypothetical protein [Puniceicoccaceae bacterium K14]
RSARANKRKQTAALRRNLRFAECSCLIRPSVRQEMKLLSATIVVLIISTMTFAEKIEKVVIWEFTGKYAGTNYFDGGSFSVVLETTSGEKKGLFLDRSFKDDGLMISRTDGKLYWGTSNFNKRIAYRGEPEEIESMIKAIEKYILDTHYGKSFEEMKVEEKGLFLILDRLHELTRSNHSMDTIRYSRSATSSLVS